MKKKASDLIANERGVIAILSGFCFGLLVILIIAGFIFLFLAPMNLEEKLEEPEEAEESTITETLGTGGGDLANANTLTVEQIKDILENKISYGYNLAPYADQIAQACKTFNINPLFALAIANHDSLLGTAGAGKRCKNPGNVSYRKDNYASSGIVGLGRCGTIYGESDRWEIFKTYGDGMQGKIWLLRANYLDKEEDLKNNLVDERKRVPSLDDDINKALADGRLTSTDMFLVSIIAKYAPAGPPDYNDVVIYTISIKNFMVQYKP